MATLPPSTSVRIAERAGLAERYVREWLASMVTGGIVDYEPVAKTYLLAARTCRLSDQRHQQRQSRRYKCQARSRWPAIVQENVLECFSTGRGLGYGDYPCFLSVHGRGQPANRRRWNAMHIIQTLIPDFRTRLDAGIDVLDAGCGSGRALLRMAELHPASRFVGYDLCEDAIAAARQAAADRAIGNATFEAP